MKAGIVVALVVLVASSAIADPHLGFDVKDRNGKVEVSKVYAFTSAAGSGIDAGDVVVSVGGVAVNSAEEFGVAVSGRKTGEIVGVKTERGGKANNHDIHVVDGDEMRALLKERREREQKHRREMEARISADRKQDRDTLAKQGAIVFRGGAVKKDAIGQPQITLDIQNISTQTIDAVEFKVTMFDKFGRPAKGLLKDSHEQTFVYQEVIAPRDTVSITANVPWHQTVGKADVAVVQYVLENGKVVKPQAPPTVTVKR